MSEPKKPRVFTKKVYLKDASFESPASPQIFLSPSLQPDIDLNLDILHRQAQDEETFFEVILHITATAKLDGKTAFVAEIKQAGIFEIVAETDEHKALLLQIGCPQVLLPFAREELASLVAKGGFPQLLLSPINFEALYQQKLTDQAEPKGTPSEAPQNTH